MLGGESNMQQLTKLKGKKVLITFHAFADVDAICSALTLKHYLGDGCIIGAPDKMNEEARHIIDYFNEKVHQYKEVKDYDYLIVVDANAKSLLKHIKDEQPYLIIDHHKPEGEYVQGKHNVIENDATSACEVILQLIDDNEVTSKMATCIMLGLITDTAFLRQATHNTFINLAKLVDKSELKYSEIIELLKNKMDLQERVVFMKSCGHVKEYVYQQNLIVTSFAGSMQGKIATMFVDNGADVAIIASKQKMEYKLSFRARPHTHLKLDEIAIAISQLYKGSGGGHEYAAALSIGTGNSLEKIFEESVNEIKKRMNKQNNE